MASTEQTLVDISSEEQSPDVVSAEKKIEENVSSSQGNSVEGSVEPPKEKPNQQPKKPLNEKKSHGTTEKKVKNDEKKPAIKGVSFVKEATKKAPVFFPKPSGETKKKEHIWDIAFKFLTSRQNKKKQDEKKPESITNDSQKEGSTSEDQKNSNTSNVTNEQPAAVQLQEEKK